MNSLETDLERWREADVIDEATAARIRAFERPEAQHAPSPKARPSLIEALLYLGLIVVVVGIGQLAAVNWGELTSPARVAALGVPAVLAAVAGWAMRTTHQPASVRGGDVTWLVAVVLLTGTAAVAGHEVGTEDRLLLLVVGLVATAAAFGFWVCSPSYPQIAGIGGSLFLLAQGVGYWPDDYNLPATGMFMLSAGVIGLVLAELRFLAPQRGAIAVFVLLAGFGPFYAGLDGNVLWAELLTFAVAGALMATAIARVRFLYLLVGTILSFVQLVAIMFEYFEDDIGAPLALILSGAVLIAAVLLLIPMRRIVSGGLLRA